MYRFLNIEFNIFYKESNNIRYNSLYKTIYTKAVQLIKLKIKNINVQFLY
jgi:hypothetical protein